MYLFGSEEIEAAVRVLSSRRLFRYLPGATETAAFEAELAARFGVAHALLVSSGTAGLMCALAALEIGPGDEVLIPGYGFVANALSVLGVGAVPVICEIDETLTLDPADFACRIGPRARAVMPVHVNGFPCDMDAISEIAYQNGLAVIEDACQAMGASFRGRPLGTFGELGVFSFNQFKILTAGEGGGLITGRRDFYERAFIYHDGSCGHSPHRFDEPLFAGLAFRASEITAAILRAQLSKLDRILVALRSTRDRTVQVLEDIAGLQSIRSHDPAGECGTTIAYCFESRKQADRFFALADESGVVAFKGDSYWHAYSEWSMLAARLGGHHPLRNPLADTSRTFGSDLCPKTLDLLARTVMIACDPEASEAPVELLAKRVAAELT